MNKLDEYLTLLGIKKGAVLKDFDESENMLVMAKWPNGDITVHNCSNDFGSLFWALDEVCNPNDASQLWLRPTRHLCEGDYMDTSFESLGTLGQLMHRKENKNEATD